MRANPSRSLEAGSLISGSVILAQRASGPYRVAICRERADTPDIVVRLDRLDDESLAYEPVCSFPSGEWGEAMRLFMDLGDAIPEASRALNAEALLLQGGVL